MKPSTAKSSSRAGSIVRRAAATCGWCPGANVASRSDDGPPVNFCKPSVDHLFTSAIDVGQARTLAVISPAWATTRTRGGKDIGRRGRGQRDREGWKTNQLVVWGMPGAAANAGICARGCRWTSSRRNLIGCFQEIRCDASGL